MTLENDVNTVPLDISMTKGNKIKFFDISTISMNRHATKAKSFIDMIWKFYFVSYLKRDFGYMTKGIKIDQNTGEGPELMFIGSVQYNK